MESKLRIYSLGIVVKDKVRGSDLIEVTPIEDLNVQPQGPISGYSKDFKGQKKQLDATSFQTQHEAKNYVQAKWRSLEGNNRTSSPDVYANQTVLLLKYGDVDEYYWTTLGREPAIQGREDVTYSFSNKPGNSGAYDRSSSYWFQVNTFEKFVKLHLSNNDGEVVGYDVILDAKKGMFSITDTMGNAIAMNSLTGATSMKSTGNLSIEAQTVTIKAKQIIHDAPMVTNTGAMNTAGAHIAHPNRNAVPK